jgi:hypothetical protein
MASDFPERLRDCMAELPPIAANSVDQPTVGGWDLLVLGRSARILPDDYFSER